MGREQKCAFLASALLAFSAPLHDWDAQLSSPRGVAFGPKGEIAIVDSGHQRVILTDASLDFRFELGPELERGISLNNPSGCVFDSKGRFILCDTGNRRVLVFDQELRLITEIRGLSGPEKALKQPVSVLPDPKGRLIVGDTGLRKLLLFDGAGKYTGQSVSDAASACAWLPNGDLAFVRSFGWGVSSVGYSVSRGVFLKPIRSFSLRTSKPVTGLVPYAKHLLVRQASEVSLFLWPPQSAPVRKLPPDLFGPLSATGQIAVNSNGLLAAADAGNHRILLLPALLKLDIPPKITSLSPTSATVTWSTGPAIAPEFPFNTDQPEWELWPRIYVRGNPAASPVPPRSQRQMNEATLRTNSTVRRSFKVDNLKPGTEYRFRVCTSGGQIPGGRISRQFVLKTPSKR